MRYRQHRFFLIVIILAVFLVYGYFSSSGRQTAQSDPPTSPVALSDPSAIQGPYFSDRDRIADRIVAAINRTRHNLDVAVYSLTQPDITAALEGAEHRGVRIRIVSDEGQSIDRHSEINYLRSRGIQVRLSGGFRGHRSLMHNKFAIFDGSLVETGSYNWTTSATSYNFENALFIRDPKVSADYENEFEHIWAQAR
jgi:phosphatidylserine/phosphatidylglycerophosphate/cardiolipin synthase-like enzyme